MTLEAMIVGNQWEALAGYVLGQFGLEVEPVALGKHVAAVWAERLRTGGWEPADWRMWLKNRLDEMGVFKPGMAYPPEINLPVQLHVFFIHLEETADMLTLLRRVEPRGKEYKEARSRIFQTAQVVHPIDRVAARTAPEPYSQRSKR